MINSFFAINAVKEASTATRAVMSMLLIPGEEKMKHIETLKNLEKEYIAKIIETYGEPIEPKPVESSSLFMPGGVIGIETRDDIGPDLVCFEEVQNAR